MKKKFLRVILCIVAIIFLIFLAKFIYRFRFFHKLNKAVEKVYSSGNYSCYYYNRGIRYDWETGEQTASYSKMGLEVKGNKIAFISYSGEDEDYALCAKSYYDKKEPTDCIYIDFSEDTFQIQPNILPLEMREKLINYPDISYSSGILMRTCWRT